MGIQKINKAEIFQIPSDKFIISASASGYTFNYSADGIVGNAGKDATPANKNQTVIGLPVNTYVKLVGNTSDDILIRY